MKQGSHPEELPAEVLDDVASVVGAKVALLSRLPGGVNGGAMRVQLAEGSHAVLKAVPLAHPNHLDETLRTQRVVEHMRRRGYSTPAWLGVGATATHVWHLMDFVDADPAPELTPSLVDQLMEIVVAAVVDIGNAGSGTRATDLTTLVWYTFQDPLLDGVRRRLWTKILVLVVWEGAAVLAAAQIPPHARDPHPSRAPRCRSRGGQARPSRPRRAERASLTATGGEGVRNGDPDCYQPA